MTSSDFQEAAADVFSLAVKILVEIPNVHRRLIGAPTLSLDQSDLSPLQFLKQSLGLPEPSRLPPPSHDFPPDASVIHIAHGLKLHKILLEVITEQPHFHAKAPIGVVSDLRDAITHVRKMQRLLNASNGSEKVSKSKLQEDLAPKLQDGYMAEVAAHLELIQLRDFAEDVSRSLKGMIASSGEHEAPES